MDGQEPAFAVVLLSLGMIFGVMLLAWVIAQAAKRCYAHNIERMVKFLKRRVHGIRSAPLWAKPITERL